MVVSELDPFNPGKPKIRFVTQCPCGIGVSVHSADCKGLIAMVPRIEQRKLCPELSKQWVVCRWFAPPPREVWDSMFGGRSVYPTNGYQVPLGYWGPGGPGTPKKYIALDPEVEPVTAITEAVIFHMKQEMAKSMVNIKNEIQDAVDAKDHAQETLVQDIVDEALGPFPNSIPGKRGGSVSLPDPHLQAAG